MASTFYNKLGYRAFEFWFSRQGKNTVLQIEIILSNTTNTT